MKDIDIYLMGDQPTTCPKCGARTEQRLRIEDFHNDSQFHICLSNECNYQFLVEEKT